MWNLCKKKKKPIKCKDCNYFYYPNKNIDGCLKCDYNKRITILRKYEAGERLI